MGGLIVIKGVERLEGVGLIEVFRLGVGDGMKGVVV